MTTDFSYGRILPKLNSGVPLSEEENAYVDMEARKAADIIADRHKSKGGSFLIVVARVLEKMGSEQFAKERTADYPAPQPHDLFGE
ncbi:hypothetical protein [uncultured Hyphomicrobium sp.]|jgi:hypothetical protein|uniref:hypothetical protein n=1 Tax=uncultured Hyphomicrobium sp. TaxID=194373 RepID=UPI0025E2157B|nr:hypothetical protein [uncultured Hyphomicrobium sp.]